MLLFFQGRSVMKNKNYFTYLFENFYRKEKNIFSTPGTQFSSKVNLRKNWLNVKKTLFINILIYEKFIFSLNNE